MDNNSGSLVCAATCWGIALLAGVLACALLMVLGGWSFLQGLFVGVVLFVLAGAVLSWLLCSPLPAAGSVKIEPVPTGIPMAEPIAEKSAAPATTASTAKSAAAPKSDVKSTQLPGQDELAARKGEWKYGGDSSGEETSSDGGSEPETLTSARGGQPDDLKKLKGVGPKLEGVLNELGFFHFDQIASWTDAEVAWVDTRLKFKGRIERDGWIEQAKILAAGGETEFSKKK